jgi:hypothetical protein
MQETTQTTDQTSEDLVGVNLAIDFDEARIIYKAVRRYQLESTHENSESSELCDGLLEALEPYVYTQRREQPT